MPIAEKMMDLIRQYDPTENEVEISAKKRRKVAQCLGVSPSQLKFAALARNTF